jgi:hypothetical protein
VTFHRSEASQQRAFKFKQKLPADARYYLSRVISRKATKEKLQNIVETIDKSKESINIMSFFANREWIFDSSSMARLNSCLNTDFDRKAFTIEV